MYFISLCSRRPMEYQIIVHSDGSELQMLGVRHFSRSWAGEPLLIFIDRAYSSRFNDLKQKTTPAIAVTLRLRTGAEMVAVVACKIRWVTLGQSVPLPILMSIRPENQSPLSDHADHGVARW